jgi:hypothetical protein
MACFASAGERFLPEFEYASLNGCHDDDGVRNASACLQQEKD